MAKDFKNLARLLNSLKQTLTNILLNLQHSYCDIKWILILILMT